jgi:hypothetical protein
MGYHGGKVGRWVGACREETRVTTREIVQEGTKHWRDVTRANTPIERFLKSVSTKPPYHLRNSWEIATLKVIHVGSDLPVLLESAVYTEVEYAPYVEEGTGLWGPSHAKYVIRPKRPGGWLSWIARDTHVRRDGSVIRPGERVFAREVLHPGSPGQHMLAIGAHMTESQFRVWVGPVLDRWKDRCERAARLA